MFFVTQMFADTKPVPILLNVINLHVFRFGVTDKYKKIPHCRSVVKQGIKLPCLCFVDSLRGKWLMQGEKDCRIAKYQRGINTL